MRVSRFLYACGWVVLLFYVFFALLAVYAPSVVFSVVDYQSLVSDYMNVNYSEKQIFWIYLVTFFIFILSAAIFCLGAFSMFSRYAFGQLPNIILMPFSCAGVLVFFLFVFGFFGGYGAFFEVFCLLFSFFYFYFYLGDFFSGDSKSFSFLWFFCSVLMFLVYFVGFSLVVYFLYFDIVFYAHGEVIERGLSLDSEYSHPSKGLVDLFPMYYEGSILNLLCLVCLFSFSVNYFFLKARVTLKNSQ